MDDLEVIELYRKYDNCRQVAEILGMSSEAVRRVLIKHNVKRIGNRPNREPKRRMPSNCNSKYCAPLVLMLRETLGLTTSEIREQTGIPSNSVDCIIRRRRPDLKLGRCQRLKTEKINAIEADYVSGLSTYEIGEKYGLHHAAVSKLMNKRGLTRGKGHGAAVEAANRTRREKANARIIAEFGCIDDRLLDARHRRELRMASRKRNAGITWQELAKRKGNLICDVCGTECDPNDKTYGSYGPTHPSVDHIVRICDGGEDVWENVRLACMACNLRLNVEANRKCKVG